MLQYFHYQKLHFKIKFIKANLEGVFQMIENYFEQFSTNCGTNLFNNKILSEPTSPAN